MQIKNAVVFVTGANRGLGRAIVVELLAQGASKVYAAARNLESINIPGVVPVKLDVTDAQSVKAAAAQCGDTTLLINNAGMHIDGDVLSEEAIDAARDMFEANFYGVVRMSQSFAPVLAANGGGAIANVHSLLSWIGADEMAMYAASKAAVWSFSNSLRRAVRKQGTQVLGLHVGYMDTEMVGHISAQKSSPQEVARQLLAGIESGLDEVLADKASRFVRQGLSAEPGIYLK